VTPEDLKYTEEHEWLDGKAATTVRVGITDYAQQQLGDVVFVELPEIGRTVGAGDAVGEVESTKSVSELHAPVAGTVTARNDKLADEPEAINADPYGAGWLVEIEPTDPAAVGGLLTADAYRALTES
jgi:glycine cleavage system H protein